MKYIVGLLVVLAVASCESYETYESADTTRVALDSQQLQDKRTALLVTSSAKVLFDNDRAFESKLSLITNAVDSIDMVYPTIANDYSTALFLRTLLGATERGVDVRLLVDYHHNYRQLAFLFMLEHWGNQGDGSFEIRLFNRPNKAILHDALMLDVCYQQHEACNKERLEWVGEQVARGELNPGAALFLSGVATGRPGLMGVALEQDALAQASESVNSYFGRRYGLAEAMSIRALYQAVLGSADIALPLHQQLEAGLPASVAALSPDWSYASTNILNHQVLLADNLHLQLGRVLQDAYHINPHPLSEPYTYIGWDVGLDLATPSDELIHSIVQLWNASFSVSLREIREQIPSATSDAINQAVALCQSLEDQRCLIDSATRLMVQPLSEKIYAQYQKMQENAQLFEENYQASMDDDKTLLIDPGATVHYLENLPYYQGSDEQGIIPTYGARNGEELKFGKSVHSVLLSSLRAVCASATPELAKEVVIYSGQLLMPSNVLTELAQMIDGRVACANVNISIMTNAAGNAKNPVNVLLARTMIQALLAHQSRAGAAKGARITYYESAVNVSDKTTLAINANLFLLGDDIFIGSTTAGVRGFMADTSSGVYIQNSPGFVSRLSQWLVKQKEDEALFTQHKASSLRAMQRKVPKVLNSWLVKQSALLPVKQPEHLVLVKDSLESLLQKTASLSKKIVSHHGRSRSQQRELNQLLSLQ